MKNVRSDLIWPYCRAAVWIQTLNIQTESDSFTGGGSHLWILKFTFKPHQPRILCAFTSSSPPPESFSVWRRSVQTGSSNSPETLEKVSGHWSGHETRKRCGFTSTGEDGPHILLVSLHVALLKTPDYRLYFVYSLQWVYTVKINQLSQADKINGPVSTQFLHRYPTSVTFSVYAYILV